MRCARRPRAVTIRSRPAGRGGGAGPRASAPLLGVLGLAWLALLGAAAPAQEPETGPDPERQARLHAIRSEIDRLELEVSELKARERGVLGELERLGAEQRLAEKESEAVSLQLEEVGAAIASRTAALAELERAQERRRAYLSFRLREIYKDGPDQTVRRFVGGAEVELYWSGLRYANYLSERDGRVLADYREGGLRLAQERRALQDREAELRALHAQLAATRERIGVTRNRRTGLLREIRDDQERRESAIQELRTAADALGELVNSLDASEAPDLIDVRKFRGLLDWPADGKVSARFGTVVHPRFKTRVPHPGLDIDGDFNTSIRSIFDGRVLFSSWMRGYGLTAIVDHGHGVLSVYAHASVLMVEAGQNVRRGESLGRVGDTGSLHGPYLYFELRVGGEPADPEEWLRPR